MPFTPGMFRSISTKSGLCRSNSSTARAPSSASATTSTPGTVLRIVRSPSRTTSWSSQINTRIMLSLLRSRDLERDLRPLVLFTLDDQCAADRFGSLAQPLQAIAGIAHRCHIETASIVADRESHLPIFPSESDLDRRGVGMPSHVRQRLL